MPVVGIPRNLQQDANCRFTRQSTTFSTGQECCNAYLTASRAASGLTLTPPAVRRPHISLRPVVTGHGTPFIRMSKVIYLRAKRKFSEHDRYKSVMTVLSAEQSTTWEEKLDLACPS